MIVVAGDQADRALAKVAHESVWLPKGKDPGEMPDMWFTNMARRYY